MPAIAREKDAEADCTGEPKSGRIVGWSAALLLVVAIVVAFANSLRGPLVYDDKTSILYNPSIRSLWPIRDVLLPPGDGTTVSGRPILNLSFALNFAFGQTEVGGYHVLNTLIHALAAVTLFGLVRRTLSATRHRPALQEHATLIAWTVAFVWGLHPLQTESVTYIAQRAESLMALFFLLTLYGFVRSTEDSRSRLWPWLTFGACLLGMATKENMVSAPIIALLYDRAFVTGSFREAWRRRRSLYLALGLTWVVLVALVATTGGNRGGSAGFDVGVVPLRYWLTQFEALQQYLALSIWPHPLVFDYGPFWITRLGEVLLPALIVTTMIAAGVYAMWRFPRTGTLVALAFAVLAPTSIIPGTTQMIVEHRMYLPLVAVVAGLIPAASIIGARRLAAGAITGGLALACLTAARNRTYRDELSLWSDTVAKRPANFMARGNLGAALHDVGRSREAELQYRVGLGFNADYAPLLANLSIVLSETGFVEAALGYAERAVRNDPRNAQAQLNLGVALDLLRRPEEAYPHYAEAVRLNPLLAAAHNDYGNALCRHNRLDEGIAHLRRALELQPSYPDAQFNLAAAYVRVGRLPEAESTFDAGVAVSKNKAGDYITWANFLYRQHLTEKAFAAYEEGVRLDPTNAVAHFSYGTALASSTRYEDAVREFRTAVQLRSEYAEAENNLANSLVELGRMAEAIPHYQAALRRRPNDATTHDNLGLALARTGRIREAAAEFEQAVHLAPGFAEARAHLQRAQQQVDAEGR